MDHTASPGKPEALATAPAGWRDPCPTRSGCGVHTREGADLQGV